MILREATTSRTDFRVFQSSAGDTVVRQNCPDGQFWLIGRGQWKFSGGARNRTVRAMDFAYSAPGEPCRRLAEEGVVAYGVQVRGTLLAKWQETERWLQPEPAFSWQFKRTYLALMRDFVNERLPADELEDALVAMMSGSNRSPDGCRHSRRLATARDMILSGEPAADSLAGLAEALGTTPAYFSASYRATYGITPTIERRRCRLERTFRMAEEQDRSLNEAAIEAGFYDASHFHRVCVAELGMTPSDVRTVLRPFEIENMYKIPG